MLGTIRNIVAQSTLNKLTEDVVREEFDSLHDWQLVKLGFDSKKIKSTRDKDFEYQQDSFQKYYQDNKQRLDGEIKRILEIAINYI